MLVCVYSEQELPQERMIQEYVNCAIMHVDCRSTVLRGVYILYVQLCGVRTYVHTGVHTV